MMKIDELQLHLTNLAQLLRSAKCKAAEDLDEFAVWLQPYRDSKLSEFMAILSKAEADRAAALERVALMEAALAEAKVKVPKKTAAKKDPGQLDAHFARLADLYHRAAQPSVTRDEILLALDELERLKPTEKDLKRLAPQLNVPASFKKAELLRQMRETLLSRKGMAERVNV